MIDKTQIQILSQIVETMEKIAQKMEEAFNKGDKKKYEQAKKEILKFQEQVSEVLGK